MDFCFSKVKEIEEFLVGNPEGTEKKTYQQLLPNLLPSSPKSVSIFMVLGIRMMALGCVW